MSGGNSSSGGANGKISSGNKRWVTEQTSLTGGNVDIYVEDKTTLKGAVIASTANDLNLDTGSVEYSNIFDSKKSTSIGGGVSGSGIGSTNGASSSANINYSLSNSTQVNIATIGEGNITVRDGGSTDKLNRDTTATQIMTSDTGMKGGATVDSDTINLLTTNPVTSVDNAIDSAAGIAFKAITDGANVVNDTMVVAEKTGNWIEYGDFEVAGDLKMTQEEYKEWQVYKQFEKKSGVDVDFSIDGVIVSEKDVKVSNIIRDLDRIQEYNDSDKVDILGNMSKEPLSPTHGEDAQIWIWATYPYYLSGKKHSGVDLGTVINSKVTAISGGTAVVHYTGEYNGKGINNVTITDSGGNSVIYKHTTYSNTISNGQWIDSGKIIGTLDKSGQAAGLWNGSHLHLQVDNKKGSNSNPLYYIFKNQPNLKWNFPSKKVEQDIKTRNPELYDSIKKYGTGEKGL